MKKNGERLEETVLVPKGDPENPLTRADIVAKLKTCAGTLADEDTLAALVRSIDAIAGADRFTNPMGVLKA